MCPVSTPRRTFNLQSFTGIPKPRFELSLAYRSSNQILIPAFISFRLGTFVPFEHFLGNQSRLLGGFNGTGNTSSYAGRRR